MIVNQTRVGWSRTLANHRKPSFLTRVSYMGDIAELIKAAVPKCLCAHSLGPDTDLLNQPSRSDSTKISPSVLKVQSRDDYDVSRNDDAMLIYIIRGF